MTKIGKEYIDDLSKRIDKFPLHSSDDVDLKKVDYKQFLQAYLGYYALSTLIDIYIIEILQDYSSRIGDEQIRILTPRKPSRIKEWLFKLSTGYNLEKI